MPSKLQVQAQHLHDDVPPDWYETSVRINAGQRFWHSRRFQEVGKMSEKVKGEILDIGSADGYFTNYIFEVTGAGNIEGIDVLPASVKYAANRYKANKKLHFSVADAHKLPFQSGRFAAVYCLEALEHVYKPKQVLKEILRVLKPGGYSIILVPAENTLFKIIWFFWTKGRGKVWHETHLNFFDGNKLKDMMKEAGFKKVLEHRFLSGMLLLVKGYKG